MNIEKLWYTRNLASTLLLPVSWLFWVLSRQRRVYYRIRNRFRDPLPVPVLVVGNISVGGTGKTPLVIWLAGLLKSNGYRPGIVSRGYGGKARQWPQFVTARSDPTMVGDEPVLIASRSICPMVVAPRRVEAARVLLKEYDCDIIISDDGLQHYALQRDMEIVVVDGVRGFGNGYCLPAGPLREPPRRLQEVDFVIVNGAQATIGDLRNSYRMRVEGNEVINISHPENVRPLTTFIGDPVHALAGIGHPERFFDFLRAKGLKIQPHAFPDHHRFTTVDVQFPDTAPVLMTEKDAVKCRDIAGKNHWYLRVDARPDAEFAERLILSLQSIKDRRNRCS